MAAHASVARAANIPAPAPGLLLLLQRAYAVPECVLAPAAEAVLQLPHGELAQLRARATAAGVSGGLLGDVIQQVVSCLAAQPLSQWLPQA